MKLFFLTLKCFFSDWRVGRKRPSSEIWAISVVRNIFEKNPKGVKSGQKVFTACRRGLKVCGREIGMSRSLIDQLRWEGVDRHDLTQPTHFMRVLNFKFLGSFHCITCVGYLNNRERFGIFLDKNVWLFLVPARCTLLLEIIAQSNVRPLRKTDLIDINPWIIGRQKWENLKTFWNFWTSFYKVFILHYLASWKGAIICEFQTKR